MKMHPHPCHVDVVACRDTIEKFVQFLRGHGNPFRTLVEVIHGTLHLIRRENSSKELHPGLGGYGHTFPEAYTSWEEDVKQSESNHRVIKYKFGGLDMLIRFDCKAYIKPDAEEATTELGEENEDVADQIQQLFMQVEDDSSEKTSITRLGFQVEESGGMIRQQEVTDIKTRSKTVKGDPLYKEIPRLWISQTPTFIIARHANGVFDDIQISDVTPRVNRWEAEHQQLLGRLASFLRHIRNISQRHNLNQFEIVRVIEGDIEIRSQTCEAGAAFSQTVKRDWSDWLAKGGSRAEEVSTEAIEEPRMKAPTAALS